MRNSNVRKLVVCAVLSAVSSVLMLVVEFSVPFMPSFIKMDFADIPVLVASFALGPVWGMLVCLIRNIINLATSYSMEIGELANFIISASFVVTAGCFYKFNKTRKIAAVGSVVGSVISGIISFPVNYFITYPFYSKLLMDIETILEAYKKISGFDLNLTECLLYFNLPFTVLKCLVITAVTMIIYKRISPIIKGK